MFVEVRNIIADNTASPKFGFIKSLNASVFPSGRRRSDLVEFDDKGDGLVSQIDKYHIPYDPESRLNTEANNTKHSSVNGFTQTYIKEWDSEHLLFSIGGYLFNIVTPYEIQGGEGRSDPYDTFGRTYASDVDSTGTCIYANIRLEFVPIYEGFKTYNTLVLRDQTTSVQPKTALDTLLSNSNTVEALKETPAECFYFSGLSFSSTPLAFVDGGKLEAKDQSEWKTIETREIQKDGLNYQRVISFKILEKDGDTWKIHQPAMLPNVQHGPIEDSIKVGTVFADALAIDDVPVPALKIVQNETDPTTYKLCFTAAQVIEQ